MVGNNSKRFLFIFEIQAFLLLEFYTQEKQILLMDFYKLIKILAFPQSHKNLPELNTNS